MSKTKLNYTRDEVQRMRDEPDCFSAGDFADVMDDMLTMHAQLSRVRAKIAELREWHRSRSEPLASGLKHAIDEIERAMEGE